MPFYVRLAKKKHMLRVYVTIKENLPELEKRMLALRQHNPSLPDNEASYDESICTDGLLVEKIQAAERALRVVRQDELEAYQARWDHRQCQGTHPVAAGHLELGIVAYCKHV